MAAPVITAVTPSSATLAPGQFVDVRVEAFDPDSKQGKVQFPVTDSQNNTSLATITLRIDDPITFGDARNPDQLPVAVQKIQEGAGFAVYRIRAL